MNNFGNINPSQYNEMLKMMNPQTMGAMNSMINSMSDEQLKQIFAMNGMPNVSPSMIRSAYQMFNNNANYNQPPATNNDRRGTLIENLNQIKEEGNSYFRQKNFREAYLKYSKILSEMEKASDIAKNAFSSQLAEMEKTVRLNIAACHLQLNDYDKAIDECDIVLKNNQCFKAYYRKGLAYQRKGKFTKAKVFLEKACELGKEKETIEAQKNIEQCTEEIEKNQNKDNRNNNKEKPIILENNNSKEEEIKNENNKEQEKKDNIKEEKKEVTKKKENKKENKKEDEKENKKIEASHEDTNKSKKLKNVEELINKEKKKELEKSILKEKEDKIEDDDDDIEINTDLPPQKPTPPPTTNTSSNPFTHYNSFPSPPPNFNMNNQMMENYLNSMVRNIINIYNVV